MDQKYIRNFAIIAHVDHGKSTLADRFLEITKTVSKSDLREQFLDQNPISRERGITIKLAPVRMNYTLDAVPYTLNLIDTPGHVDFSYEVSRTLAACEGAILLVDATQGIQAQTVAHFQAAKKQELVMIPVINKIDLPSAQVDFVKKELIETFSFTKEDIMLISAKTGQNVEELLKRIVEKLPNSKGVTDAPLRALIFDGVYDEYRGVVAYVRIIDGEVKTGDKVRMFQSEVVAEVTEVGYFSPFLKKSDKLAAGEIGYIITGIKDIRKCRVGDTIINSKFKIPSFAKASEGGQSSKLAQDEKGNTIESLPGYKIPKPMVFLGVYPKRTDDLAHLKESLSKLILNDTALTYVDEYSAYLGSGFRVGFLGLLHAEIVKERLLQEFNLDLLFTMPHVLYEKKEDGSILEPYMKLTIYTPISFSGAIMSLCQKRKGVLQDATYRDLYAVFLYEMPYSMFMRGLSSELKSASSGFASIDYEVTDYRQAEVVNLEIRINDVSIDILSELVYKDEASVIGRQRAEKLKEVLTRQQFRQIIQALVNGVIVAREEISPFRKDVLAKMSGGDRTRKDKLLKKQKKGKARMIGTGKVILPQEALLSLIESS